METQQGFPTPFNVVAAFRRTGEARRAMDDLARRGVPLPAMELHQPHDGDNPTEIAEQRSEMQDELDASWPVTGIGMMTETQAKGAGMGALLFAGAGALVGLVAGLVWSTFDSSLGTAAQLLIAVLISVAGFTTIGFIVGGGVAPRLGAAGDPERVMGDRRTGAERDALVGVHLRDRTLAEQAAAVLAGCGAEHVHFVDGTGTPLPPQASTPRPADPEGWWWKNAGHG
jgi:hypothetical protein